MSGDVSHCTLYGHSWVHRLERHAYVCNECGAIVTQVEAENAAELLRNYSNVIESGGPSHQMIRDILERAVETLQRSEENRYFAEDDPLRARRYPDEIQPPGGFTWGRSVIDHIERPPVCAPLDHEWRTLDMTCRVCGRKEEELDV